MNEPKSPGYLKAVYIFDYPNDFL